MGTVFQHLPKISEETIYSITLFKKSNKISKMKAFILCCALFFIGCVNGAPWWSETSVVKRSDGLEHLANRAGPQEREVVEEKRMEERMQERAQERIQERAQERMQERFLAHKRNDEEAARWDPASPRMALL